MKFAIAIASICISGSVFAAEPVKKSLADSMFRGSPQADVKTGSDVPGCTFYRIETGQQVCDPNSVKNLLADTTHANTYSNAFSSRAGSE